MIRQLPRRILASALLSVILAFALIILGASLARPAIMDAALSAVLDSSDLDSCAEDPLTWGAGAPSGLSVYAYDREGHSSSPSAPPLEPELLAQALTTNKVAREIEGTRVTAVVPRSPSGPCAIIRVHGGNVTLPIRRRVSVVLIISILGGMLLAAVGTLWFVVLPLRARIDTLARAAKGVGTEAFEPTVTSADSLGSIAELLAKSHARILESRATLEQRNDALQDHLAGIAHDLRTPLSSMQLALEAVADESDGALQTEARRALSDVVYLSALVENLHQATRLRHAIEVSAGRVELTELVRRLERRFVIVGRHAGVEVAASAPEGEVWVACRPELAERAIANLVQNAVGHNEREGHVAITLCLDEHRGRFELSIADDGPGLPEGAQARLEHETFLVESARRRGPGLGMLITAEVARRAGWEVTYEPLEPRGVRVRVTGTRTEPQPPKAS